MLFKDSGVRDIGLKSSLHNRFVSFRSSSSSFTTNVCAIDTLDKGVSWSDFYAQIGHEVQSDTLSEKEIPASDTLQQNVTIEDNNSGTLLDLSTKTNYIMSTPAINAELADYVKRPVNIITVSWEEGATLGLSYYPWKLYLNKTSLKRKFDNYYLMRGNLHIKLVINASPFYYGSGLLAYQPLYGFNPAPILDGSDLEDRIPYSQRPNIYFDAASCKGGEMVLPFVYHKEWLNITSNSDVEGMGQLILKHYTVLKNANGVAGGTVDIQVFAWMEDLQLSGPTEKQTLQSDEYQTGPVSKIASAISRSTNALSQLPVIGPFMTATSAISKGIGDVAYSLGFSNPPNIDKVAYFKTATHPQLATTEISVPYEKLTIDSKNELSIDPKISGAELGDEMCISNFVQRESFLGLIPWAQTSVPDTAMFAAQISPTMNQYEALTNQNSIYDTPMGHMARCFKYWRGDIIFRFRVVATPYHKGRVKIVWDPAMSPSSSALTESYTKIVDIAETRDFEFRVPYIQPTAYLKTSEEYNNQKWNLTSLSPGATDNGVLEMKVFNKLTAPDATSDIAILVFVRAADNLEFAAPRELPYYISYYEVQSDDQILSVDSIPSSITDPNINLVYMGESIQSIRQLVKRMGKHCNMSDGATINNTYGSAYFTHTISRRPRYYGYDLDGPERAEGITVAGEKNFNWVSWHYITWFAPCFVAERGSINWIVNVDTLGGSSRAFICRDDTLLAESYYYDYSEFPYTRSDASYGDIVAGPNALSGVAEVNQLTQSVVAANIPMYNRVKFQSTSANARTLGISGDDSDTDSVYLGYKFMPHELPYIGKGGEGQTHLYVGAGVDYSLVFFLNVPVKYLYANTPVVS